jgi:hypothetical protein
VEPSLLGVAIAFYGYMADCIVAPTALVKLTPPAGALGAAGRSRVTTPKDSDKSEEPEKGSTDKASSGKS